MFCSVTFYPSEMTKIFQYITQSVALVFCAFLVNAQTTALSIGNKNYTAQELSLEYNYQKKNDTSGSITPKKFIEQFIKQQLYIRKAEADGKLQSQEFIEEAATLRKELANNALKDVDEKNRLVQEAYNRMAYEVNVSHILIACSPFASPSDTMQAFNKAFELRVRLQKGENFEDLARLFSSDKSVGNNRGNLGYITALQTIYEFETAAYNTPAGQISLPVRTPFGYHLIKVNQKRPFQKFKIAHIFLTKTSTDAEKKINELYNNLLSGRNFETLAKQYSQDVTTASKGGAFNRTFGVDELEPEFENAISKISSIGSISAPVATKNGWHIIKLIDRQGLKKQEEMQNYLENKVEADSRGNLANTALIKKLKTKHGFTENLDYKIRAIFIIDSLISNYPSLKLSSNETYDKILFSIGGRSARTSQFLDFAEKRKVVFLNRYTPAVAEFWYKDFTEREVMAFAEDNLEATDTNFALEFKEIKENLLINTIYDQEIWTKSLEDTTLQVQFYHDNLGKYNLPERIDLEILDAANSNDLKKARESIEKNPYKLSLKWSDLYFKNNESELSETHTKHLKNLLLLLAKNPNYVVEVSGNSDPNETEPVSKLRAEAVEKFLLSANIRASRIMVKDNSKFNPLSKSNRDLNSRVEFNLFSTQKQDVFKLMNSLRTNSIKHTEGVFAKGQNEWANKITWAVGQKEYQIGNRYVWANVRNIQEARTSSFNEAKGQVIKGLQTQLEQNLQKRMEADFPVVRNEAELQNIR
jgi:peptidyl-prolyl cis-trans isomerase SurA